MYPNYSYVTCFLAIGKTYTYKIQNPPPPHALSINPKLKDVLWISTAWDTYNKRPYSAIVSLFLILDALVVTK